MSLGRLQGNVTLYILTISEPFATAPLTIIPAILFLVFVHPAPAEDCPCFEDAVAFLAVTMGLVLGHHFFPAEFLGATFGSTYNSTAFVPGSILATSVWAAAVLAKLVLGELMVTATRNSCPTINKHLGCQHDCLTFRLFPLPSASASALPPIARHRCLVDFYLAPRREGSVSCSPASPLPIFLGPAFAETALSQGNRM